jgi:hypothetical protein
MEELARVCAKSLSSGFGLRRDRVAGLTVGMPTGFRGMVVTNSRSLTREPGLLA